MRGVDGEFRPPTLKGMAVVYIKDMNIYCEVCDCHIKKSNWGKHLKTTKHGIACGEIVVEEVEKKQCWKCRGHKGLEMFRGGMLLVMDALLIGKNGQEIMPRKLGSCGKNIMLNIGRR